jgi:hypothetical protein
MKHMLKRDLLKQFIPVAVIATVAAIVLVAPAVAAKGGGKGPNPTTPTSSTLSLTSDYVYWPATWEPNCMTEDDMDVRSFSGSLSGSYSTSFVLCDPSLTGGYGPGGEGLQSVVSVSGTLDDLTITAPDGTVTHAVYLGKSNGYSNYEICAVPPYFASNDSGSTPLAGGTWTVTLSGSISSVSWKAQVRMTDVNFQQANCPTAQQNIIS